MYGERDPSWSSWSNTSYVLHGCFFFRPGSKLRAPTSSLRSGLGRKGCEASPCHAIRVFVPLQNTTWSPAMSRRSLPTASGRGCSSAWATSSPSPASPGTGWRARRASPASGGGGVCGVRLCQGVLVGGHVLSFCLVGFAVLDRLVGQGRAAHPGGTPRGRHPSVCRLGGAGMGRGSWHKFSPSGSV